MTQKPQSKAKKIIENIINVLVWVLLIVAVLITIIVFTSQSNGGVPKLFGKMPVTILTDSMAPKFVHGDMIINEEVKDFSSLKKDDIITFWTYIDGKKVINTHRIAEVQNSAGTVSFVTKGDANPINDETIISPADIIGKYSDTKIPYLGTVINFLQSPNGFLFCIVLPLLLFFLYELYRFIVAIVELKHAKNAPVIDEEEIKRKAIEEYISAQKDDTEQK
ncbi:MAG: signal peptidase I [Oscillospiraceae bacterium]